MSAMTPDPRTRAQEILQTLSLSEKVGQLVQVNGDGGHVGETLRAQVTSGATGSVLNEVDPGTVAELQRLAREESRHGIPLLIGRDVIHGFRTVMPIPLGMAASFNDALVEQAARVAATEASDQGVNWTFSPMLDVCRDPRWGRIAEGFGEDPLLTANLGAAMVRGYQHNGDASLVSCLKHLVGYGASESGRDYNRTYIPDVELHNVYLPAFAAGVEAGAMTVMPSFSDLNGMPPSGNRWLLRDVLREALGFDGFVVSDWASVAQLAVHGVAGSDADCAQLATDAGVNMDMASGIYAQQVCALVERGQIPLERVDDLVLEVLTVKVRAGLFERAPRYRPAEAPAEHLQVAQEMAQQSFVLLRNQAQTLPLVPATCGRVALLGPLADEPAEQLGTWVFDGDETLSVSLRAALHAELGERLVYDSVLGSSRDRDAAFDDALELAANSDVVVLALGEEAILSGEAHCRADLGLPGAQTELVRRIAALGKPLAGVVMAGRPLVLSDVLDYFDALFFAPHPGCMAGPAFADLLFGRVAPSARLPVTLPRHAGQIPIYYNHGNTGKPPTPETVVHIDDIDARAPQLSVGNTSFHLDVAPSPLFEFGYGLTYAEFHYADLQVERPMRQPSDALGIAFTVTNASDLAATEVVQVYVRDHVARIVRPVRELKKYARVDLAPGESRRVAFDLTWHDLSYHDGRERTLDPGRVQIWVGGSAAANLTCETEVLSDG